MPTSERQRITAGDVSAFIAAIRAQHQRAFDLARDVGAAGEFLRRQPRRLRAATSQAMEFLAHQAHPTFGSVQILAERALIEDAATLTRRLLELSGTASYVGSDNRRSIRDPRARCFLGQVWREFPADLRKMLPPKERARWARLLRRHNEEVTAPHFCRLPKYAKMFEAIGKRATYDEDYSLLSTIAHGSPPTLVLRGPAVAAAPASAHFATVVLVFACRYYLGIIGLWGVNLGIKGTAKLAPLTDRAMKFFDQSEPSKSKA